MAINKSKQFAIHLGRKSRKEIRRFTFDQIGDMNIEIRQVLDQMSSQMEHKKELIPIVFVHRQKRKYSKKTRKLKKLFEKMALPGVFPRF